jgi:hypothetical protein
LDVRHRLQQQLEQLESKDFSDMGYEARIRHQRRIDALKAEIEALAPEAESSPPAEPVPPGRPC